MNSALPISAEFEQKLAVVMGDVPIPERNVITTGSGQARYAIKMSCLNALFI
ncbi:3-deoxy-manno-octulosonate cytidylyltransferase [Mariprofundus ferrooxydans PV-1]|uniref:3-deoxy-manno-octulosonate cytidylyltransferase n=1 Tax=Mariprofundus ferrooxydans PV-1 TaxID=314345 RepID=Q0F2R6_9PROT|nr:3-deoxy-manno-octulosonate cytidylyltransferase [Mariprofundus ferrooxydans PV-1]